MPTLSCSAPISSLWSASIPEVSKAMSGLGHDNIKSFCLMANPSPLYHDSTSRRVGFCLSPSQYMESWCLTHIGCLTGNRSLACIKLNRTKLLLVDSKSLFSSKTAIKNCVGGLGLTNTCLGLERFHIFWPADSFFWTYIWSNRIFLIFHGFILIFCRFSISNKFRFVGDVSPIWRYTLK